MRLKFYVPFPCTIPDVLNSKNSPVGHCGEFTHSPPSFIRTTTVRMVADTFVNVSSCSNAQASRPSSYRYVALWQQQQRCLAEISAFSILASAICCGPTKIAQLPPLPPLAGNYSSRGYRDCHDSRLKAGAEVLRAEQAQV